MKTLEQKQAEIMAKAQADMVRAEKECEIVGQLPIDPRFVYVGELYGRIGSAKYNAKDTKEAFSIWQQFQNVAPAFVCKSKGSASMKTFDDEKADHVTQITAWLDIERNNTTFNFYADIVAGIVKIEIELPTSIFGRFIKSEPNAKINYKLIWQPTPKTNCLQKVINYAPYSNRGEGSENHPIYGFFDIQEIEQFLAGE